MTQVLVAMESGLGIGSGAPNRQPGRVGYSGLATPAAVQFRLVPVSASVVGAKSKRPVVLSQSTSLVMYVPVSGTAAGSGIPTPAPPK